MDTAYRLAFVPTDRNLSPEECMPIFAYDTLAEASAAALRDCIAHGIDYAAHGEDAEAGACERTARAIIDALIGEPQRAYTLTVTAGDNPRTIGAYVITPLRFGSQDQCSTCGDFRGIVTEIRSGGNIIACCEDCEADAQRTLRDERNMRGIRRSH